MWEGLPFHSIWKNKSTQPFPKEEDILKLLIHKPSFSLSEWSTDFEGAIHMESYII